MPSEHERLDRIEKRMAALERNVARSIGYFNSHVSRHERVSWTDPVTKAMRIICDYVGRYPVPGESKKNFPTQKDWGEDKV